MTIAVAMSGGVDSTAAALLLLERGHDVQGLTMLTSGPAARDVADRGSRAASALGIPHQVVDLSNAFEEHVVVPFARAYAAGRTPNPCVLCNRTIKFGALHAAALESGADALATGHYARLAPASDGSPRLFEAVDDTRDQSYFIASVTSGTFTTCLLPLGPVLKRDAVRRVRDAGLSGVVGAESRDICFLPDGDMRSFLERHAPEALVPGAIEDAGGTVLGEHSGLGLYTVGQRTGLGLSRPHPTYVLGIDAERNTLVVGDEEELACPGLTASGVAWIRRGPPGARFDCDVRIRSASPRLGASVEVEGHRAVVRFAAPARAVAPGQAVVFYRGDEVLGAGTIERGRADL
ncbi:MAG: tRNA 2-thiouridine(34) synthase MnmA [Candidatus Eisenbacteria bacterium]|nr:tRNA 2-thiouridine(34) synthase MnmA [Candidatus Eisenbacteria bacterium]